MLHPSKTLSALGGLWLGALAVVALGHAQILVAPAHAQAPPSTTVPAPPVSQPGTDARAAPARTSVARVPCDGAGQPVGCTPVEVTTNRQLPTTPPGSGAMITSPSGMMTDPGRQPMPAVGSNPKSNPPPPPK